MPRDRVTVSLTVSGDEAFALIHDYGRRLEWDPFLREAVLLDGASVAGPGVLTRCSARWIHGGLGMVTQYVSWQPGRVAAVRMTGRTPFFQRFAATMRHRSTGPSTSSLTYIYSFRARPRMLAWLLEPLLAWRLRRETVARLAALARFTAGRTSRLPTCDRER